MHCPTRYQRRPVDTHEWVFSQPFGHGLVTVVRKWRCGENCLFLWHLHDLGQPVHTFVGHTDVVLEFQWRRPAQGKKKCRSQFYSHKVSFAVLQTIFEYGEQYLPHKILGSHLTLVLKKLLHKKC